MGIKISIEINIDENTDPKIKELAHLLTTAAISGAKVSTLNDTTEPGTKPARVRLRRPPERPPLTGTPAERWVQFLDKAPARTRDFAQLIEAGYPNFVTQADAMKALGITQARAIGGLTGSMRRWAVADKLELPWASTKQDGERVWIWCGFDESGELRAPPEIFAQVEKENAPPANYDEYFERLSERSQNFLRYLEREKRASIAQTMAALDIKSSKALGGLAGSLNRWGRAAGVPVPFVTEVENDEKYFRWIGIDGAPSNPKGEAPQSLGSEGAQTSNTAETLAQLGELLPNRHNRFLKLLKTQGVVTAREACHSLGVEKASGIEDSLTSIKQICNLRELVFPVAEHTDAAGTPFWTLIGWEPTLQNSTPSSESLAHDGGTVAPGVRRRRQRH